MPERERPDYAIVAAQALLAGAVVCALAALVSFLTGDVITSPMGEDFRTHVDAVWVLGTLAVTMLVAAYLLANEHNRRT